MTILHHTPIPYHSPATAAVLNSPLAELDAAMGHYSPFDYGAVGDGTTDDIDAVQAALDAAGAAGGGTVLLSAMFGVSHAALVPSNVTMRGAGWGTGLVALSASWTPGGDTGGYLVANENYTDLANGAAPGSTYSDTDIVIEDLCLDFGGLSNGNYHALELRNAQHIRVSGVLFQCRTGNGDALACRHVDDIVVEGCTAFDFANAAWDFWANPSNVFLRDNYAKTAATNQIINFNPEEGTTAIGFVAIGNICVYTGATSCANILSPLGSGSYVEDVVVIGNRFVNCNVTVRGDTRRAIVANNIFESPAGLPAVFSYTSDGGTPSGLVVSGNVVYGPAITVGNLGVIRVETSTAVIAGNVCVDGNNAVPFIYVGATFPTQYGNSSNTDTTITHNIANKLLVSKQIYPGAEASGWQSSGGLLHSTGVPSNANGNNNDWCISDNGHLYFRTAGAWVQKV